MDGWQAFNFNGFSLEKVMLTITELLTDQDDPTYCAHPDCHCRVLAGEQYCSLECEKQSDGEPCFCRHPDCQLEHKGLLL
jgi:hypothetical protein